MTAGQALVFWTFVGLLIWVAVIGLVWIGFVL